MGEHTEKTKDLVLPLNPATKKDRDRPGRPQRWIPRVTNQGKQPTGQMSSRPPSPLPPFPFGRKREGWLALFFPGGKREVFVALIRTQR